MAKLVKAETWKALISALEDSPRRYEEVMAFIIAGKMKSEAD